MRKHKKIIKRRDVTFNETDFDLNKTETEIVKMVDVEPEASSLEEEPCQLDESRQLEEPHCSERQRRPPIRYGFNEYADTAKVDHLAYNVCQVTEPKTIEESLKE